VHGAQKWCAYYSMCVVGVSNEAYQTSTGTESKVYDDDDNDDDDDDDE